MSFASWAIRFAASQEGVVTVLSGMSSLEQMDNNLSYMKDFQPLNAQENDVILKARDILSKANQIACTGCHYCTEGCPMQIPIPGQSETGIPVCGQRFLPGFPVPALRTV